MTYVNGARNALRDKLQADVNESEIGSDGTEPSVTDTSIGASLATPVVKSESGGGLTESDNGDGGFLYEFTVTLSEANGETIREVVLRDSGTATLWIRIVHADILKENDFELDYEISGSLDNP